MISEIDGLQDYARFDNQLPMDILDKLRDYLKDSEFVIVDFGIPKDDYINVKLAYFDK